MLDTLSFQMDSKISQKHVLTLHLYPSHCPKQYVHGTHKYIMFFTELAKRSTMWVGDDTTARYLSEETMKRL